jgi:pimeloyl-ACP methyl ester carboxylesterase
MTSFGDVTRAGSGEPLLLIHGFTATYRIWGALPQMLSDTFDVLAPTLPGHTGGPVLNGPPTIDRLADELERMLDEVGWKRAHVCGFSLGGWLALELAKRGRATSVVALSPGGAQGPVGGAEAQRIGQLFRRGWMAARACRPLLPLAVRSPAMRRQILRDMMVHGEYVPAPTALEMIRAYANTPVFDELLREMGDSGGLQDLDRVDVPVHVVWGERDRVLPKRHAEFFREAMPHATFHVVRRAGHVPFWDAPSEYAEQIRKGARPPAEMAAASGE